MTHPPHTLVCVRMIPMTTTTPRTTTTTVPRGRGWAPPSRSFRGVRGVGAASSSAAAIGKVLDIARDTNRGVDAGPGDRERVERAVDEAVAAAAAATTTRNDARASHGRWRLAYTTEKETLWLLGKGSDVAAYQTIDNDRGTLVNEVIFGGDGNPVIFRVDATTEIVDATRVNFKFSSASLTLANGWRIPIPPVGAGWFDNVYVVNGIRVSRDSRGDTLVCERA